MSHRLATKIAKKREKNAHQLVAALAEVVSLGIHEAPLARLRPRFSDIVLALSYSSAGVVLMSLTLFRAVTAALFLSLLTAMPGRCRVVIDVYRHSRNGQSRTIYLVGANGGSANGIEFVNRDGQTLIADGTWQRFAFTPLTDPLTAFAGTTANAMLDDDWGVLEHIRIANVVDGATRFRVWIDDIDNTIQSSGPINFANFESATLGTEVVFQEPRFSGSTSALLQLLPNTSLVTNTMAHTGTQSNQIDFEFLTDGPAPANWLRLTTSNTPNQPNPLVRLRRIGRRRTGRGPPRFPSGPRRSSFPSRHRCCWGRGDCSHWRSPAAAEAGSRPQRRDEYEQRERRRGRFRDRRAARRNAGRQRVHLLAPHDVVAGIDLPIAISVGTHANGNALTKRGPPGVIIIGANGPIAVVIARYRGLHVQHPRAGDQRTGEFGRRARRTPSAGGLHHAVNKQRVDFIRHACEFQIQQAARG